MDLWIRSQDRCELRKVNGVVMAQEGKFFAIYPVVKELGELEFLGHYKSEERALEVLDEIQKLLTPQVCELAKKIANNEYNDYNKLTNIYAIMDGTGTVNVSEISTVIYEMPKE